VRLGLLPDSLEMRGFTDALPELLVYFVDAAVADPARDEGIVALHEKLSVRHYPTDLLQFLHAENEPAWGDGSAAVREADPMTYREFKAYRQAMR
jgi:hypothetical protein